MFLISRKPVQNWLQNTKRRLIAEQNGSSTKKKKPSSASKKADGQDQENLEESPSPAVVSCDDAAADGTPPANQGIRA
jgi:hypothetical protein